MKRHTARLLAVLLVLATLFSCAPVEYPSALQRNAVDDKPVIYVTPYAKKAEASFTPSRNADSYEISLNGEMQSVPLKVKEGMYTFTLKKLEPETRYELKISAVNTEGKTSSNHIFWTTKDMGELEYAPLAYMSARSEESVTITIHQMPNIFYRITMEQDGQLKTLIVDPLEKDPVTGKAEPKNTTHDLTGLETGKAYKVKVEHRKDKDQFYSSEVTELTIPVFRPSFTEEFRLLMKDTTATIAAKDSDSASVADKDMNITLLFYPDGSGVPEIMETRKMKKGEELVFDISRLGILRSGLFDAVITDTDGKNAVYSEPAYYTTPVIPIIDRSASDQKSVTLTWTQPEDINEIIYTISGESTDKDRWKIKPGEVEISGSKATLRLDDLVSNTEYALQIEALLPNEEKSETTYTFTTDSFSGVYRWVCPTPNAAVPSFVIEVWDHKDAERNGWEKNWNENYPYHVFVHESDPAYSKEMEGIAIMPLFRGGDEIPTDFISYSENDTHYKMGYHWNEMKWNATGKIHPSAWKPDASRDVHGPDTRTSYTLSKALGTLTTKTDFTFRVKDGEPQIVFRNAGDGKGAGTVNIGLFKNPKPEPGTDQFTFVLNRIGSVSNTEVEDK